METEKNDSIPSYFTYEADGFSFVSPDEHIKIKWLDIESIVAYKMDLVTVDEIRMDIVYDDLHLTITEETPGWGKLISKLKSIFPSIPSRWDLEIVQPPFATNQITLYQKGHHKVFVDFQNSDPYGRVRLNTNGALEIINELGENFKENIYVLLDDNEELKVFGLVKFSPKENIWVAEINWDNLIKQTVI